MSPRIREMARRELLEKVTALEAILTLTEEVPPRMIAQAVCDLIDRAHLYCPDELANMQASMHFQRACFSAGICSKCGNGAAELSLVESLCSICRTEGQSNGAISVRR